MSKLLYTGSDWTEEKLEAVYHECEIIGAEELGLDWYPNVFEIVGFDQMLEIYSSTGMPMMYNHWSFGKSYLRDYSRYKQGRMGLALEMVINSDPCINYLMEENSMTAQALVIAHASIGHNSFFKNNYLFKQWTHADSIIDYLSFAKNYIAKCEDKYGADEVELILDCAHALQYFGIDKYQKPKVLSAKEEEDRQKDREEIYQQNYDEIWDLIPKKKKHRTKEDNSPEKFLPNGPEENLLYFLEKKSPILKSWQREILRIVRKIRQYFYPQGQTKTINEGWASTVHYYIMNRLYDKGLIDDGAILEFLSLHTSVVYQPEYNSKYYSGFNPYHLGFSIFADIKRMSQNPTEEDKRWFPDIAGGDWKTNWHHAYQNFRDESFIHQFLSPKVMRDLKLFSFATDPDDPKYTISNIHDDQGYKHLRKLLASQQDYNNIMPDIHVSNVDFNSRKCVLTHFSDDAAVLDLEQAERTLEYFEYLWGFDCEMETVDRNSNRKLEEYGGAMIA